MKKVLKITMMIALLFFGKYSSAQNPLWVLAPKYLDEAQNPIPLPTGPSYIPYENYTGFPSQFGASAIANIDNSLKFFVIDGFIYDNDGSYIEYAWSTAQQPTYTVQINDTVYMDYPRGNGSDLIIIPHPLDCEKFYLIASVEVIGDRQISTPNYALFDYKTKQIIKRGRWYTNPDVNESWETPIFNMHGPTANGDSNMAGAAYTDYLFGRGQTTYAVTPKKEDGSRYIIGSFGKGIITLKLTSDGELMYWKRFLLPDISTYPVFSRGETEVYYDSTTNRTAIAVSNVCYDISLGGRYTTLQYFEVDLDNLIFSPSVVIPLLDDNNDAQSNISGLEFSPNGRYLYFTCESNNVNSHELYYYDKINNTVQALGIPNSLPIERGNIEIDKNGDLIFAAQNGLYKLTDPNNPNLLNFSNSPTLSLNITHSYLSTQTSGFILNSLLSYDLPNQLDKFNYSSIFSENYLCCIENRTYTLDTYTATSGTWSGSSPAAPGLSSITIKDELRIPAGTTLAINNMTLQFAPGARLIIENGINGLPGGKLTLNGTTLTIDNRCGGNKMWSGVQVWGNSNQTQGNIYSGSQGLLVMNAGSLIEHAIKGAVAVRNNEDPNNPANLSLYDYNYTGGVIIGRDSYFRNNVTDVEIMDYNPKSLVDNASKFTNCEFYTDGYLLNQAFHPETHVLLSGVSGIEFYGNTFENRTPNLYEDYIQGYGIRSRNSKFTVKAWCTGFYFPCTNYQANLFKNLFHGIHAVSSNPLRNVYVSGSEFINNYRGILLSGIDYAAVLQNQFEVFSSHIDKTYGLYLEACSAFKVEENYLTEYQVQNPASFGNSYGIIVSNSGESHNEIYNNDFKHLRVGGQSQGINGVAYNGTNNHEIVGLQWRCNTFLKNMGAADLAVTSGRIDYQQGYALSPTNDPVGALKSPAGNVFSHDASYTIFANSNVSEFEYYHHADNITTPLNYSSNIVSPHLCFNSQNPVYYDETKSCPSKIRKIIVSLDHISFLKHKIDSLDNRISNQVEQIDFGNTTYLLQLIAIGNGGSVKNELMAASPYLSDQVLLAYIQSNPSNGHLKQVILANSPLSPAVEQALANLNLPNGIQNQITNAQQGVSEMKHLISSIAFDRSTRSFYLDEEIRTYLNDTLIENPLDSVAQILKFEEAKQRKQHLCMTYFTKGDSLQTNQSKDELIASYGMDNYVRMIKINQDKKKYSAACVALNSDTDLKQRVIDVANDMQEERNAVYAENVLTSAYDTLYVPVIEDMYPVNTAFGLQNSSPQQASNEAILSLYPNPSDGTSNITIEIKSSQHINYNNAEVMIFTLTGQLVESQAVKSADNQVHFDASNMKKGIYLVKLFSNNQLKDIQKFVVR